MLLITIFVEPHMVAGRSQTRADSPKTVSRAVLRRTTWSEHGMASVNHTRLHYVNQMEKTHSKPLAARHGSGKAWARHGHDMGAAWARHGRGMGTACYVLIGLVG
jgi:hypothetical protein